MHVQVVTYRMAEISEADFVEADREFAAMMAVVPGLLTKIWLRDPTGNVYGGVYVWKDRAAFEAFLGTETMGRSSR